MNIQQITMLPLAGIVFALGGFAFAGWAISNRHHKLLWPLCGLCLSIAALNAYVEEWKKFEG